MPLFMMGMESFGANALAVHNRWGIKSWGIKSLLFFRSALASWGSSQGARKYTSIFRQMNGLFSSR